MRSGETAAANQGQKTADDIKRETKIEEELANLDAESFERILKDVAEAKVDLLKNVSRGGDPALVSIMGLIDDAKGRLAAEKEHNNPTNTKAPVKFDEVVDFIDDGAEDIADEKAPVVFVKKVNITSPVRGNPVVNLDELNGNVVGNGLLRKDSDEENHVVQTANDPYSQMELGNAPTHYYQNLMGLFSSRKTDGNYPIINSAPEVVQPAVDDVDLDKLERSQKNFSCDEQEQIEYQNLRDTREVPKIRNVLGPVSEGFFASFGGNPSHVLGCDLSVINPVSVANANVFQTLTSNGRLLPAIPRRYFPPNELPLHPRPRPGIKSPVTIMLNHPVHHNNSISDSIIPQFGGSPMSVSPTPSLSPPKSPPPPPPLQDKDNQVVSASTKKRNKKKAKKAAAVSDVITEETVKENEIDEETAPAPVEINSSVEGEEKEDGENENDDGMTEEEREARRLRNRKDRLKKKQKKEKMEMEMKALDVVAQQREQSELVDNDFNRNQKEISPIESNTSQEESPRNMSGRRGKNKKSGKVTQEYTVPPNDSAPKKLILTEDRAWIVSLLKDGDFDSASDFALKKQYITVKPNFDKSKQDSGAEAIQALLRDLGINPEDLQEHQSKKKGGKNKGAGKSKENNNNQKQQKKKDSESKKMDEDSVAASLAKHGTGRNSEEDDNQSFISAQEDVEESISRLSTPPTEFQDARQSRDEGESLMDDPRNYATEDEFAKLAEILNKQNQNNESSEGFITVHHGKKKALKNSEHEATSSTSPQNRRPSSTAGSSSSQPHHHHQQQQNQGQRNVVRPHATTFGDFVDTTPKKDTHKNTKNKKGGNSGSGGGKKQQQHARTVVDNDPPPPSPMFEDALDRPLPLTVGTSSTFSYADVAKTKKSSGDSSPSYDTPSGGTVSPIPPNLAKKDTPSPPQKSKSPSPVPSSSSPSTQNSPQVASFAAAVSGAVQLPPSTAAADDEFQFGYHDAVEEPENRTKKEEKADDVPNASPSSQQQTVQPQRMSGMDLLNQLRNVPVDRMPELSASEAAIQITKVFDDTWHTFMNTGSKPIVYTPGQPTKK